MSNFRFLQTSWPDIFREAAEAEALTFTSPKACAILCRSALENTVVFQRHPQAFDVPRNQPYPQVWQQCRPRQHYQNGGSAYRRQKPVPLPQLPGALLRRAGTGNPHLQRKPYPERKRTGSKTGRAAKTNCRTGGAERKRPARTATPGAASQRNAGPARRADCKKP